MKHSRIWDTLSTSKLKIFVTIGIYNVIFLNECLYLCQFVTGFILPQVIPASETVFFVTITIANLIFYWAIVLHVQFLFMNFFSVLVC